MPRKPRSGVKKSEKEMVRVTFRFHGPELAQIRDVQDMLSLNTEVDAARYLMQRGLEAMMPTLVSRRVQGQMKERVNPEALIEPMIKQLLASGCVPKLDNDGH